MRLWEALGGAPSRKSSEGWKPKRGTERRVPAMMAIAVAKHLTMLSAYLVRLRLRLRLRVGARVRVRVRVRVRA